MKIGLEEGKYLYVRSDDCRQEVFRYGESWREETGDNFIWAMADEVERLREVIEAAKNCLVCAAIAPAYEVCKNTLDILEKGNPTNQQEEIV